ncbi:hypothetical protein K438DRAFT_1983869 [Mycena galopus ATCC 62051]|nr:hypothetical protein K438DRAFT_1983869 [Mycena galopus ATCC 62051]
MFIRFRLAALGRANPELVDVVLSQVNSLACQEVLGCNATALAEEYGITGALAPREEVYGFKYAMDVMGGFLGLLRSGSLVFKACFFATLFEEDFNSWLRPYERFILVRMDLSVLFNRMPKPEGCLTMRFARPYE